MTVKRYEACLGDFGCWNEERPDGLYVKFNDYAALERVAMALRNALVIAEALTAEKCIAGPADHGKMRAALSKASGLPEGEK